MISADIEQQAVGSDKNYADRPLTIDHTRNRKDQANSYDIGVFPRLRRGNTQ